MRAGRTLTANVSGAEPETDAREDERRASCSNGGTYMAVSERDRRTIEAGFSFLVGTAAGLFWITFPFWTTWSAYRSWDQGTESTANRPWFKRGVIVGVALFVLVGAAIVVAGP
jgi:hypothetical protein